MTSYGQFCPVAKAMEVLDERWTLLVVRELLLGSTHFTELRRGVPRMSPTLLATRLRSLERAGLVERRHDGPRATYALTAAGRELSDVVEALGRWGSRWVGDLGEEDLDPHLLLWDMRRTVPVAAWPDARTVVAIRFDDVEPRVRRWWIVVDDRHVDVCDADPGFGVDVDLLTSLRDLTRVWRGDLAWPEALRAGRVVLSGPADLRRAVPAWIGSSTLAVHRVPGRAGATPFGMPDGEPAATLVP